MADSPEPSSPLGRKAAVHWKAFFQATSEPLFLLNRKRRLLFVNRAWEALTGLPADQALGLVCTRRRTPEQNWLARLLCPPAEVLDGSPGRVRRLVPPVGAASYWWDLDFFPLMGEDKLLCVLGKIRPVGASGAAASGPLSEKLMALRTRVCGRYAIGILDSDQPTLRRVVEQVRLAAQARASLLLVGETGTGKETVARVVHYHGMTRELAFVAVDCGRLPPSYLGDLLFDDNDLLRRPGVGTVYFRNVSALPREMQAQLADHLHDPGPSTPRIAAGCEEDPDEAVRAGRLLHSLYCAVATLVITLAPLRERMSELPTVVQRVLDRLKEDPELRTSTLTPAAWETLRAYFWPGNLRELHAVLAGAAGRSHGGPIDVGHLPASLRQDVTLDGTGANEPLKPMPLDELLAEAERRLIRLALQKSRGNKSKAADLLSVWRPRLLRRMEALGIEADEEG